MESLYILIPIAIVLVCIAVGIFLWAVKSEQFEDLERQGHNILFDEDTHANSHSDNKPVANKQSGSDMKTVTKKKAGDTTPISTASHVHIESQTESGKKNDDT
ncbi:cbb3-type cytochrome oxidase assembly protein CcoS [uncultured Vibrio sp.]|uniref:cbb3-type cytochrome oxidase assembly protein CcoS n=1 Tax=uncultured Vibrio sp. TaxID=114054 RepID=UPI00261E1663|nr:cbb3-type cytochrome oxidase assembly protein CcoS [uncultured Vibrio sp.]